MSKTHPLVTEKFGATLDRLMDAESVYLPICRSAEADLKTLLAEEDTYTYASVSDHCGTYEVVKIYKEGDDILVKRGIGGTTAVKHIAGSVVCSIAPLDVIVIKDLVCSWPEYCCEGQPCECTGPTYAGELIPAAKQSELWEGSVIFTGDLPMSFGTDKDTTATWIQVAVEGSTVKLSGTPNTAGTFTVSIAASGCGGTKVAVRKVSIVVSPNI